MQHKNNDILSLFWTTARQIKQQLACDHPFSSLTIGQLETLRYVAEKKQVFMKELANSFNITPPSATAMIDHLAKLGLITRSQDKKDRRNVYLTLTSKGGRVYKKTTDQQQQRLKTLLGRLNPKEKNQLIKILMKMSSAN